MYQSHVIVPEWMNKVFALKPFNNDKTDYYILVVPEGTNIGMIENQNPATIEKQTAMNILSIIEKIYFSEEYRDYRFSWGTKGAMDLIIQTVQDKYGIVSELN